MYYLLAEVLPTLSQILLTAARKHIGISPRKRCGRSCLWVSVRSFSCVLLELNLHMYDCILEDLSWLFI